MTWGVKLLCSLVLGQRILLYLLPDDSRAEWTVAGVDVVF